MTKSIIFIVSIVLVASVLGGLWFWPKAEPATPPHQPPDIPPVATPEVSPDLLPPTQVIGQSVEGRDIRVHNFGDGDTHLVFVGGIHGGYEWNSVVLANEIIALLDSEPELIPANVTVSIIPKLNPDGVVAALEVEGPIKFSDGAKDPGDGTGRLNANGVDLNRNFDCKWQPKSSWRRQPVSAGTAPFSEPEAVALRDFVLANNPTAVVFWHSKAGNVYGSECEVGPLPETLAIMNIYAEAADYGAVPAFTLYPITGDAEAWLASINIPAITVELTTHQTIELEKNIAGVKALFDYYRRTDNRGAGHQSPNR